MGFCPSMHSFQSDLLIAILQPHDIVMAIRHHWHSCLLDGCVVSIAVCGVTVVIYVFNN